MRLGIRAQLLLSIAALLLVALVGLFFAVSSLTRATMQRNWERNARALGRAVAGHVIEARGQRRAAELNALLEAQLSEAVAGIALYDRHGELMGNVADSEQARLAVTSAPHVTPNRESVFEVAGDHGPAVIIVVPSEAGSVGVLVRTDARQSDAAALVSLVALYTGLLGLTLLVFLYFVLTRLVVAPIERLSLAAGRVAGGARELTVPQEGGRELVELSSSLSEMMVTLRAEELQLRRKVDELETATQELEHAQAHLVRSERLASVGRLAAGLAHEIGNPITAILSFQELLLDGELDGEQRDFVERMKRESERVNRILRDLLDFARPMTRLSQDEVARSEEQGQASVREAIDHVVALVKPQRAFKQVELMTTTEDGLPPVSMQPERVEQVLVNLLLNAADEAPKPGGRIAISAIATNRGTIEIAVEDNGGGIDPDVRDRLFEPFVSTKDVGKGTGLGLAVCRGLVEAAGGTIRVEDGNDGARFILELPAVATP